MLTAVPADTLAAEELAALWNRAYADYFVPVSQTPARLTRHIAAGSIDLARSVVLADGTEPVAFSLLGVRGAEGWIGGFGVVPERRRAGLSSRLLDAQLALAARAGVRRMRLEVLTQNWARRTYERGGFKIVRRFAVLGGTLATPATANVARPISLDDALAVSASLPSPVRCWQREPESMRAAVDWLHAFVYEDARGGDALLVAERTEAGVLRLHEAVGDVAALGVLVSHAAHVLATPRLLCVNEPEGSAADRALRALGCDEQQAQWEMSLAIGSVG